MCVNHLIVNNTSRRKSCVVLCSSNSKGVPPFVENPIEPSLETDSSFMFVKKHLKSTPKLRKDIRSRVFDNKRALDDDGCSENNTLSSIVRPVDSRIPVFDNKPRIMTVEESPHETTSSLVFDNKRTLNNGECFENNTGILPLTLIFDNKLDKNSLNNVIALAKHIGAILISSDSMEWELSPDLIECYIHDATISLGHDVKYDANTFDKMELRSFQPINWELNDQQLLSGRSFDELITTASVPLRLKGETADQLRASFRNQGSRHLAIDILSVGQRVCTNKDFKPNGAPKLRTVHRTTRCARYAIMPYLKW